MKISLNVGLILLSLFLPSQGAQAAIAITELSQPASIAGLWQFRAGDDLNWAVPNLDDRDLSNWTWNQQMC